MKKKKALLIFVCLMLLAVVVTAGIWIVKYRCVERSATQAEIHANSIYIPKWSNQDEILAQCTAGEDGFYTSETLGQMLFNCERIEEISQQDGLLHVAYQRIGGGRVGFDYDGQGLVAFWVWDEKNDLFYQTDAGATVTTNYYQSLRQRVQ